MFFERFGRRRNQEANQIHLQKFRLFFKEIPRFMLNERGNLSNSQSAECQSFRLFTRNTAYFSESMDVIFPNTAYVPESVINLFRLFPPKYRFFCVGGCYPRNAAYFSGWNVISPKYHSFSESVDVIPKYYLFFRVSGCYFPE